jgi:hypothetical protein
LAFPDLDSDLGHDPGQIGDLGAAMHDAFALCADGAKISAARCHRHKFNHAKGWRAGLAAPQAIHGAGRTGALPIGPPLLQEVPDCRAVEQGRSPVIVGRKAGFLPVPHGVLVDGQALGQLLYAVTAVQPDAVGIVAAR